MYVLDMQVAEVPDGLAGMAVGAELAVALHAIDPARVANYRLLEVVTAQYRQLCHEQARMVAVLAEVGRSPAGSSGPVPGRVVRSESLGRFASEETRAALRWTRKAADSEHDHRGG